jgi:hypothetical protein
VISRPIRSNRSEQTDEGEHNIQSEPSTVDRTAWVDCVQPVASPGGAPDHGGGAMAAAMKSPPGIPTTPRMVQYEDDD